MAQDVVRRRDKEVEIWEGELLQIVVALQFPFVPAGSPADGLVLCTVDLRRGSVPSQRAKAVPTRRLASAKLVSSTAGRAGGVTPARRAPVFMPEVCRLPDLAGEAEHVRI